MNIYHENAKYNQISNGRLNKLKQIMLIFRILTYRLDYQSKLKDKAEKTSKF